MDEAPMGAPAADYRKDFERERQRLTQLYDAYELQEKELQSLKEKSTKLDETIAEKDRVIRSLREVLSGRDAENRELHIELSGLRAEKSSWEPRLKELEANIRLEQDRFGKLFKLSMDLDAELKEAKNQIEARDRWYRKNILVMSNIKRAMDEHDAMISEATGRPYEVDLEGELMRLKGPSNSRDKKGA
jgi:chromosome segregation ATPase